MKASTALLSLCLVVTGATAASAQTTSPVDVAVGYRLVFAEATTRSSTTPLISTLPFGFDVTVSARVSPVVSLVGAAGRSVSTSATVLTGGVTFFLDPTATGTVSFAVTDVMGGLKFSRRGSGLFTQVLAGRSMPDYQFKDVSGAGQSGISLDQGPHSSFAIQPTVGLETGAPSARTRFRVSAGLDWIFGSSSSESNTTTHFRVAAAVVFGGG